ncbi:hypothetical protein [Prevotella sp.]|uniref:hypothetical protein n=1 Tax=Prevotella sp. TaxID=59823 RepID=UPI003F7CF394
MFNKILLTSALLAVPIYMSAANDDDDDTSRRWAVIAGMNLSCPTTASYEQSQSYVEKAGAFGSPMGNLMLEYYLSNDHFSLVGGYNTETLEWFSSDVSATMRNISVGSTLLSATFQLCHSALCLAYDLHQCWLAA